MKEPFSQWINGMPTSKRRHLLKKDEDKRFISVDGKSILAYLGSRINDRNTTFETWRIVQSSNRDLNDKIEMNLSEDKSGSPEFARGLEILSLDIDMTDYLLVDKAKALGLDIKSLEPFYVNGELAAVRIERKDFEDDYVKTLKKISSLNKKKNDLKESLKSNPISLLE